MRAELTRTIIAEIGINHDGDMDKAKRLIQQSRDAGCDGIKFQYRNMKTTYAENANEIGDEIIQTQIKRSYLNAAQILELRNFARSIGIQAGISFFTIEDLNDFQDLRTDFDFYKIPSAELMNIGLISKLISTGKHVYISVGMHDETQIETVFNSIKSEINWTPLHCISNYPVADHNTSLGYIQYLIAKWGRAVGYSSHDENWENNIIALSLGATVIERHITDEKNAEGLDHSSSSTFEEFVKICSYAREFDSITSGNHPRIPNQGELLNKQNLGRSFYALRDIGIGEILDSGDFEYRNPRIGIGMSDLVQYVGRGFVKSLSKGEVLTHLHFQSSQTKVRDESVEICRAYSISLPVRLSDYREIRCEIPIGAYEFHLSYKEVASDLFSFTVEATDRFSVHLPDYIDSTTLINPLSDNERIRISSRECIARVIQFSERLARETGRTVPIVASLAGIGLTREEFYPQIKDLFDEFHSAIAPLTLQWLPPYAWYFGGSIKLTNVNSSEDIQWINSHDLPITLDSSHLLLGKAAFGFEPKDVITGIAKNIVHWHISDAAGVDGEGLPLGAGGPENEALLSGIISQSGIKVIEIWQGHFYQYEGFKVAVNKIAEMKGVTK
jgi:sialic acid synthase SpsE/sugar phosphate isomerase/epimerase